MTTETIKNEQTLKVVNELLQIEDLDLLLEYILTEVRRMVCADAGSIYLTEGTNLKFSHAQNNTLQSKLPFGKKLIYSSFSLPINTKSIAGYVASTSVLLNVQDAYNIDSAQPDSFDKYFDELTNYQTRSVLTVAIKSGLGKVLGVIQVINAFNADKTIRAFTAAEENILQFFADKIAPAVAHAQMMRAMIRRTNKILAFHDPHETIGHAERVAAYAVEVYEAWAHKHGVAGRELRHNRALLRMAAMLHDVGKIFVAANILQKKATELSADEISKKEQHTIYGARLFSNLDSDFEKMARIVTLTHHEKWDGNGYPGHVDIDTDSPLAGYEKASNMAYGKSGAVIPICGRITAVVNTYDKLTYKGVVPERQLNITQTIKEQALAKIVAASGTQFDPEVVAAFVGCIESINALGLRYLDQ